MSEKLREESEIIILSKRINRLYRLVSIMYFMIGGIFILLVAMWATR